MIIIIYIYIDIHTYYTRVQHMSVHIILLLEAFLAQQFEVYAFDTLINPLDPSTELIYYNARNGYKDLDHLGPGKFRKVHESS